MTTGYLGLDLGGTSAKAGVYDSQGRLLGYGNAVYTPIKSSDGYIEIPVDQIYTAAREAVREAVGKSNANIRAMAVSSQGETFVTLDKNDRPLHPAIMWYDSRATAEADALRKALPAGEMSVPLIEAISTAPKIMWMRANHPDTMSKSIRYLLLPDYISYMLTREAVTDPCTASTTGLYADDSPDYMPEALGAAQISQNNLARIQQSGTPIATLCPSAADEWGLSTDTLLVVGTNDQYAGALGAGNCRPGIVSETTGTCLALVTLTEKLPSPLIAGLIGGRFPIHRYQFALAYSKTAGVVLEWFKQEMCQNSTLRELDEMASSVPLGSRDVMVLPHFDGMVSPKPNPDARGFICNLTLGHTGADIYRAILESLTYSLRENIELLVQSGFNFEVIRSIGGGAKSDLWLQIKADVTGLPVERPKVTEAATLGAAILAAVGSGEYSSIEECSHAFYQCERVFHPDTGRQHLYENAYSKYLDLSRKIYG